MWMLLLFLLAVTSCASMMWLASVSLMLAVAAVPLTVGLLAALFWRRLQPELAERATTSRSSTGVEAEAPRGYLEKDMQEFITGFVLEANRADSDQWEMGLESPKRAHRSQTSGPSRILVR